MPTQPLWNLGPGDAHMFDMLSQIGGNIVAQRESNLNRDERERERQLKLKQQADAGAILGDVAAMQAGTPAERLMNLSGSAPAPQAAVNPRSMPSFAKVEGSQPSENIRGVIQAAAAQNALSPEYMTRMASIESGGDPNARNPSGAAGLFQFVPSTWKQYGGNGSPFDPGANALAAAAFTKDNQNALRQQLGREPTYGELYLAHQQGAGGAAGLLANPDRPAAEVVGLKAVASNLPRGAGDPRNITAGQFASLWTNKFQDLDASRSSTPNQPAPGVPAPARPAPVVVAENEDQVRAAEAGMMPRAPQLPPMAAGRAGLPAPAADLPAPGAVPAGYTVPPAPGSSASGEVAGAPATAVPPSRPVPAPEPVLSQGLRAAASSGMPPQQVALVRRMAMNPILQPYAAQIIEKYSAPQKDPLQRFTGKDGNEYAFDPGTGRVAPVAAFNQPDYDIRETKDGRTIAINKRNLGVETVDRGIGPPRGMTPDEERGFSTGFIDASGTPHYAPKAAQTVVQAGEKAFEQKEGEAASKRFSALQDAGDAARVNAPQIAELGEIFSRVPPQGKAAEWKQTLGPYAQAFGIDVGNLSDIQTAEAIVQRIAPQQHVAGTGSQSDLEYKGLIRSLPTLMQDPQTRATTLAFFQSQNDLAVKKADIVTAMRSGDISRGDAEKALRALPDPLTRFREFRKDNQAAFGAGLANAARRDKPGAAEPSARVQPGQFTPEQIAAERKRRGL